MEKNSQLNSQSPNMSYKCAHHILKYYAKELSLVNIYKLSFSINHTFK